MAGDTSTTLVCCNPFHATDGILSLFTSIQLNMLYLQQSERQSCQAIKIKD